MATHTVRPVWEQFKSCVSIQPNGRGNIYLTEWALNDLGLLFEQQTLSAENVYLHFKCFIVSTDSNHFGDFVHLGNTCNRKCRHSQINEIKPFLNHYYNFAWSFVVVFIFINEKTCFKTHWLHCSVGYDGAKREKHLSLSYPTQTSLGFQNEQLVEAVESKAIYETQESRRLLGCSVPGGCV